MKSSCLLKLDNTSSGCPVSLARGSCIKRSSIPVELEVLVLRRGKTGVSGKKNLLEQKKN